MRESLDHGPAGWIGQSRKCRIQRIHNRMVVYLRSIVKSELCDPDCSSRISDRDGCKTASAPTELDYCCKTRISEVSRRTSQGLRPWQMWGTCRHGGSGAPIQKRIDDLRGEQTAGITETCRGPKLSTTADPSSPLLCSGSSVVRPRGSRSLGSLLQQSHLVAESRVQQDDRLGGRFGCRGNDL